MKSAEIREKTGLSEKALRLYEDKGLVTPEMRQQGSRYIREYSEEDLAVLMTVASLRKARFSLEQIGQMLDDPHSTRAIFTAYREELAREMAELSSLMEKVDGVADQSLTNPASLAAALTPVSEPMELPVRDMQYRPYKWEDISDEERRAAFERFWQKQEKRIDREYRLLAACRILGRVTLFFILPALIVGWLLYAVPFSREVNLSVPAVEYNTATGEVIAETTLSMRGKAKYYLFQPDCFEGVLTVDGFVPRSRHLYERWNNLTDASLKPEEYHIRMEFGENHNYLNVTEHKFFYALYREPLNQKGLKWTEYIQDVYYADPKEPFSGMVFYIMVPYSSSGSSSGDVRLIAPAENGEEASEIWTRLTDRWAAMYN